MQAAAEYFFVDTSPKELLIGFRCTPAGLPPYCKELWKSESDLLFYVYRDGGAVLDVLPADDLPEILDAFRGTARDGSNGESVEEYGPEAYSEPAVSTSDGNATYGHAEAASASPATAESGS